MSGRVGSHQVASEHQQLRETERSPWSLRRLDQSSAHVDGTHHGLALIHGEALENVIHIAALTLVTLPSGPSTNSIPRTNAHLPLSVISKRVLGRSSCVRSSSGELPVISTSST
ncbi:hypothetical protein Pcac1_g28658 [Phytophthora cactorum]|nr:hypothetical protein Pcac1_g28658 [Phytophthora cactorum]